MSGFPLKKNLNKTWRRSPNAKRRNTGRPELAALNQRLFVESSPYIQKDILESVGIFRDEAINSMGQLKK